MSRDSLKGVFPKFLLLTGTQVVKAGCVETRVVLYGLFYLKVAGYMIQTVECGHRDSAHRAFRHVHGIVRKVVASQSFIELFVSCFTVFIFCRVVQAC